MPRRFFYRKDGDTMARKWQWWRYALDKLIDGSLSDKRVLKDLYDMQREAQNSLSRIKRAGRFMRYHGQIKDITMRDVERMTMNEAKAALSELADYLKDDSVSTVKGLKNMEKEFFNTDIGEAIKKAADGRVSDKDLFVDYQDFVNKANTLGKWDERRGEYRGSLAEMFYSKRGSRGSLKRIMNAYNVRNLNEVGEELYEKLYAWKQAGQPNTRKDIQKYFGK